MTDNKLLDNVNEREQKNAVFGQPVKAVEDEVPYESVPLPSRGVIYPSTSSLHNKETLDIKVMTATEEDILSSRAYIKKGTVITELLKSCILDKTINVQDMISGDKNAVMISVRITGYGAIYPAEVQCGACEHVYDHDFDLSKLEIKRLEIQPIEHGKNLFHYKLPVSGKDVLFKFLTGQDEDEISRHQEVMKKKLGMIQDKNITSKLKHCIIEVDGDSNRANIAKFVDRMRAKDSKDLRKYIDKHEPGILMKQETVCPACGNIEEVTMPFSGQFFWPD